MKKLLSLLLFAFCCACSYAQKSANELFEQATLYLQEEKDAEAIAAYRKAAEMGHPLAMEFLGDLYRYGIGVEEDIEEACRWYKLAAEEGNGEAMYKIGYMYYYGYGVEESNDEAFKWFSDAAELGNENGTMMLASCYRYGFGTERNLDEAIRLFTKMGNMGNIDAMQSLAFIYSSPAEAFESEADSTAYYTDDEPAYPEEAFKWFLKAAEAGDFSSMLNVGSYYEQGIGVKQSYDKAEKWYMDVAEADIIDGHLKLAELYANCGKVEKAEGWYMKAMDIDDRLARYHLARLYAKQGRNHEAIRLFKELADDEEDPHYSAASDLADLYYKIGNTDEAIKYYTVCDQFNDIVNIYDEEGRLSEAEDYVKEMYEHEDINGSTLAGFYLQIGKHDTARDLLLKLANEGDVDAMTHLGYYYQGYEGFPKDLDEAKRWLNNAIDAGSELAEYWMNELLEEEDKPDTATLLLKAKEGDAEAMTALAATYFNGETESEMAEGLKWLKKAADTGNKKACFNLAEMYYTGNNLVEKDMDKCISMMEKAAQKGDVEAQFILLQLYIERNKGKDQKNAKKLISELLANESLEVSDLANIVSMLLETEELHKQFEEDFNRVLPLIEKEGSDLELYSIAEDFRKAGNLEEAFKWFKLSVDKNPSFAAEELGHCYFYGRGTQKDYAKAVECYKKAYKKPYEYALCLYHGYGTEANPYKAIEILKTLAEAENENAQKMLKELGIFY